MKIFASIGTQAITLALLVTLALVGSASAQSTVYGTTGTTPNGLAIDAAGNIYTSNT